MEMHRIRGLLASLAIALGATAACAETLDIKGVTRTFITQFPDTKPAPLVIVLHGNTQSGADVMARTSWPAVAKRERFGVIFPDGPQPRLGRPAAGQQTRRARAAQGHRRRRLHRCPDREICRRRYRRPEADLQSPACPTAAR